MTDLGRSDQEVGEALRSMLDSLNYMISEAGVTGAGSGEVAEAYDHDVAMSLCLNPKKIDEEYHRIRKAAFAIGEDAEVFVNIGAARNHLAGWKGKAADAFRAQLDRIEIFASQTQHTAVMFALQYLGALYAMAYHMRQSYHDLAVAVKAAADHEVDENVARVANLYLAIGVNFVEAALNAEPGAAVSFVVKGAAELAKQEIEGDGADFVVATYLLKSNELRRNFADNLQELKRMIWMNGPTKSKQTTGWKYWVRFLLPAISTGRSSTTPSSTPRSTRDKDRLLNVWRKSAGNMRWRKPIRRAESTNCWRVGNGDAIC